jgi:hypothetical protein
MAHSNGDPLWVVPTKIAQESLPLGEMLKMSKQSVMSSRLQKQMVSPTKKPLHVSHSPSVATMSIDE